MVLTNKQKEELNKAILDYLITTGYKDAAAALQKEAAIEVDPKQAGVLEKKWTSIIRLQKKIMELEGKNAQLEEELNSGVGRRKNQNTEGLPRPPAAHELTGHRNNITSVVFHPVFSQIASASEDATVKIWDYESGEFERTLKGHTNAVQDIAYDHSGNLLASCSADLTVKIWNTQTYECTKTLHGHDHNISCIIFSPSGDNIITCSRDKSIRIWETSTGYCIKTLLGHDEWVRKVTMNEEGNLLASCSNDQTVRIWDFSKGQCISVLREHTHVVECIAFSPATVIPLVEGGKTPKGSGAYIASGSRDKTIKIWDVGTGQSIMTLTGHDNWVRGVRFHPNGKYLLSVSDDKTIRIWDLKQQRIVKTINDAHSHFIACLDFNNKDPHLATGGVDQIVKIWTCK
eukprot:TRINITY_DN2516_c0_g1_i2.p1 TRINITY_DN2516_c0_g1~~TRINITY_DN2516_c0_g1_i2.p1  ORF type:complete len:402 (+),score=72.61 TRINITY_DN2516_c0_g1_i2:329-1534(+)